MFKLLFLDDFLCALCASAVQTPSPASHKSLNNPEKGVSDTRDRMAQLLRGIEYVQYLIDEELKRLRVGVVKTSKDTEMVDGLTKALRGDR